MYPIIFFTEFAWRNPGSALVGTQRGTATGAKKNTAAAQQPWPSPLLPEETVRLKAVVSTHSRCEAD